MYNKAESQCTVWYWDSPKTQPPTPWGFSSPIRPTFVSQMPVKMSHFHVFWDYGISTAITGLYFLMSNHRMHSGTSRKLQKHEDTFLLPLPKQCVKVLCMKPVRKREHLFFPKCPFPKWSSLAKLFPKMSIKHVLFLYLFQHMLLISA